MPGRSDQMTWQPLAVNIMTKPGNLSAKEHSGVEYSESVIPQVSYTSMPFICKKVLPLPLMLDV